MQKRQPAEKQLYTEGWEPTVADRWERQTSIINSIASDEIHSPLPFGKTTCAASFLQK